MDLPVVSRLNLTVFAVSAAFFLYDITIDILQRENAIHLAVEFAIFALVLLALGRELVIGSRLRKDLTQNREELSQIREDFADKIRDQFSRWQLTQSETEIAWLIVKGFSFAEIARLRGVREKTVRQQATSIYAKSGADNRNDLTALFIEDLLNPNTPTTST
jgi:DNA-binding NarL/FixJ family response regulator